MFDDVVELIAQEKQSENLEKERERERTIQIEREM